MKTKGLTAKVLVGMLLGAVVGLVLIRYAPSGLQPGDTLEIQFADGGAQRVKVGEADKADKFADVLIDETVVGRAVLEKAQKAGHVKLPNGKEVSVVNLTAEEAAAAISTESDNAAVSVKLVDRKKVSALHPAVQPFYVVGELFIRLLKMVIIPLIVATVLVGIASLGDIRKMGRMGWQTILFYVGSMLVATTTGIILVNAINPGDGLNWTPPESSDGIAAAPGVTDLLLRIVPTNPVEALATMDVLGILFFTIILALAILAIGKRRAAPLFNFFEALNDVVYVLIGWIMALAPIGVGALIAYFVGTQDPAFLSTLLASLGKFALCVVLGLLIQFTLLTMVVGIFGKYNPFLFVRKATPMLATAIGTDSSSATLPVTMTVVRDMGVSKRIAGFVVPVGATANMDGTALYEATAVLFFAQAFNMDLSFAQQVIVAFTAMLAAVGAAGIPSAGLVTMALVLTAVGLPLTGIGLLLAIDRPLDMMRTAVNVYGDATTSRMVQTWNPDIDPADDDTASEYESVEPSASRGD